MPRKGQCWVIACKSRDYQPTILRLTLGVLKSKTAKRVQAQ